MAQATPRPGADRVLALAVDEAKAAHLSPVQALGAALAMDGDNDAHFHAYFVAMETAGMGLTPWWGEGRAQAEVVDLLERALFEAQVSG